MVASWINTNLWWWLLLWGVKRLKIMSTEMMRVIPILCCLLGEVACPETVTRLAGKCNGMIGMETNLLRCWNMSPGTFFFINSINLGEFRLLALNSGIVMLC